MLEQSQNILGRGKIMEVWRGGQTEEVRGRGAASWEAWQSRLPVSGRTEGEVWVCGGAGWWWCSEWESVCSSSAKRIFPVLERKPEHAVPHYPFNWENRIGPEASRIAMHVTFQWIGLNHSASSPHLLRTWKSSSIDLCQVDVSCSSTSHLVFLTKS